MHGSSLAKNAIIDEMENDYVLSEQTRLRIIVTTYDILGG